MAYVFAVFIITFLLGTPVVFVAMVTKSDRLGLEVNHYWAYIFFFLIGVPMEITHKAKLCKNANYIFCPNHFSFLDIAILPFLPIPFKFVGKVSIVKLPLLGFVFKKLHITVDRTKLRDRYASYKKSRTALANGFSLAIFPEGGIKTIRPPLMGGFKEGPFRMAVETGTKLVPITLADSWHIFPDDGKFLFRRRKCRMVIHEPIDPAKYTIEKLKEFQEDVRGLMQEELDRLNAQCNWHTVPWP